VAKVMVSLPDEVLQALDLEAQRQGTSRSGLLRELAESSMRIRSGERAERMAEIDQRGPRRGYGGEVAQQVKAGRPR
jgi:metal-responsive CopG/Arc/MetJ family transcriptional regulator